MDNLQENIFRAEKIVENRMRLDNCNEQQALRSLLTDLIIYSDHHLDLDIDHEYREILKNIDAEYYNFGTSFPGCEV